MALRGLQQFNTFDFEGFIKGKTLLYVSSSPWVKESETLGAKVKVLVARDDTPYSKADITNLGENLEIKVKNKSPEHFSKKFEPMKSEVSVSQIVRAVIWGDFRNNLAIESGDIIAKGSNQNANTHNTSTQ